MSDNLLYFFFPTCAVYVLTDHQPLGFPAAWAEGPKRRLRNVVFGGADPKAFGKGNKD